LKRESTVNGHGAESADRQSEELLSMTLDLDEVED
jgi:hypothetical protein